MIMMIDFDDGDDSSCVLYFSGDFGFGNAIDCMTDIMFFMGKKTNMLPEPWRDHQTDW